MSFVIRQMREDDIQQVQDVAQKSWHSTYEGIIPLRVQDNFLKVAYSDEMMKKRLKHSHVFVATIEDEVVGFSNFTSTNTHGQAELSAIYLYEEYQGKGIGTALLQHGLKHLDNVKEVYINVEKDNTSGINFYKAKGFKITKEYDDNFDGHILKTIRMSLTVNAEI